jgi:predicted nucleotidyltransferase
MLPLFLAIFRLAIDIPLRNCQEEFDSMKSSQPIAKRIVKTMKPLAQFTPSIEPDREILDVLISLRDYLKQEYQDRLDRVILFGSQARGDATIASDIDVLIVLQDPVNASAELDRTSQLIAQLCLEHNLLISRLFMARSRFETENSPLLRNIRSDGIIL